MSDPAVGSAERRAELRKQIWTLIGSLIVFVGVLVLLGQFFEPEVRAAAEWIHATIGPVGLPLTIFINDVFFVPMPVDYLFVLLQKSAANSHWWFWVALMGLASQLGGIIGYFLGGRLPEGRVQRLILGGDPEKAARRLDQYGTLAVFLAAATFLPWNTIAWTAGYLRWNRKLFLWLSFFRYPRAFAIYFLVGIW